MGDLSFTTTPGFDWEAFGEGLMQLINNPKGEPMTTEYKPLRDWSDDDLRAFVGNLITSAEMGQDTISLRASLPRPPKPKRYVVEVRPPRADEYFLDSFGRRGRRRGAEDVVNHVVIVEELS